MAVKKTIPWNKDRRVGARTEFTQDQLFLLRQSLSKERSPHDLALLCVGIDTMLRVSDLLPLKVRDLLREDGSVRTSFPWQQQKTDHSVTPVLTPTAAKALLSWIKYSGKQANDFIFTRHKPRSAKPISADYYRKLVKRWVNDIGLDSAQYSTHSVRRTKAIFLYKRGVKVEFISDLLGHINTEITIRYLGITNAEARALALEHDIFNPKNKPHERHQNRLELSNADIKRIAQQVVRELIKTDLFTLHQPSLTSN